MPINHSTIPADGSIDAVGYTEWAESHTLPTLDELGATALLDGKQSASGWPLNDDNTYAVALTYDTATQKVTLTPTGGWRNEYSAELRRRLRRKLQLEDDEETVEAALEAAGVPIPAPVLLAPADDVVRLRGLVKAYTRHTDEHTKRAQRAMDYAARAKSALAYELALREIAKEIEDEEAVVFAILLLH